MKLNIYISTLLLLFAFSCSEIKQNEGEKENLHFSNNFLNKLIDLQFIDEEYHLFYKYVENDSIKGIGCLTSFDLVDWQKQKSDSAVFYLQNFTDASIIRDWNNISGVSENGETLLLYLLKNDKITVSFSNDAGKIWKNFNNDIYINTNLKGVNDIKISWNDDIQKWIMILLKDYDVEFYASNDLINWNFQSTFDIEPAVKKGVWESVEFFPLEYPQTNMIKWCLAISITDGAANNGPGTQYFVGDFNEYQFVTGSDVKWMDAGTDFYNPVILTDYLILDKAPFCIGKIQNGNLLTLPRKLSFTEKYNEFHLLSNPTENFDQLQRNTKWIVNQEFKDSLKIKQKLELPTEINLTFGLNNRKYLDFAEVFGCILTNENDEELIIGYHNLSRYFFISFQNEIMYAPCIIEEDKLELRIIFDNSTVELFCMNGFVSMAKKYSSKTPLNQLTLFAEGGKIVLKEGAVTKLTAQN